jgi:Tfp pilus assembly protein PilF
MDDPPPASVEVQREQLPTPTPSLSPYEKLERRLIAAVRSFNDEELVRLIEETGAYLANTRPVANDQLLPARMHLARCDLRRYMRKTFELERKRDKELREEQANLAKTGLTYAQASLALDPNASEGHRVAGELYIHQITGPITGFRFGPKGQQEINKALELNPNNVEARRAIGLMYLYNPPINGGDPPLAATTFDQAIQLGGDDRAYVLAARAYLKLENLPLARTRLEKALQVNPRNREAQELIKQTGGR